MLIATALAGKPGLLIADEPTTALDMTVQKQILDLLQQRRDKGESLLLISHDLSVVGKLADRMLVMHQRKSGGRRHRRGTADRAAAPLTRQQLLAAVPGTATRGLRLSGTRGVACLPGNLPEIPVLEASGLCKQYALAKRW